MISLALVPALLEKPIQDGEPDAIKDTKNLYTSCINISKYIYMYMFILKFTLPEQTKS